MTPAEIASACIARACAEATQATGIDTTPEEVRGRKIIARVGAARTAAICYMRDAGLTSDEIGAALCRDAGTIRYHFAKGRA